LYQPVSRIIGGLLVACGLVLGAIGIGILVHPGAEALVGTLSFLAFGSVFAYAGYRYLRTPADGSELDAPRGVSERPALTSDWQARLFALALASLLLIWRDV
jgi:hypothetical protein